MAAKYAIAWTAEPVSRHNHEEVETTASPRSDLASGINQLLRWIRMGKAGGRPTPPVHYHHASLASDLFTFLRYVFVDDDNMMPGSLRKVIDPATGNIVEIHNQTAAIRILGAAVPFHDLWSAYQSTTKNPPEVSRAASKLSRTKLSKLSSRERNVLADLRLRFEVGFTAS